MEVKEVIMVVIDVMGGGSHVSPVFLPYKYAMQKNFYDTMKYNKMNDGIFVFLCLQSKYFLRGFFTLHKNYFHEA
jgi:hypothetical protein